MGFEQKSTYKMKKLSNKDKQKILEKNPGFISIDDSIEGILILTNPSGCKAVCTTEMFSGYWPLRKEKPVEIIDDHILMYYEDGYANTYHKGEWIGWFKPRKERPIEVIDHLFIVYGTDPYGRYHFDRVCYRGSWLYEVSLRKENPVEVIGDSTAIVYRLGDNWCTICHNNVWIKEWFNSYEFREENPFETKKDGVLIIHEKIYWRIRIKGGDVSRLWPWES